MSPADPTRLSGTVLAFDFGTRRTGVAVGQTITATAAPLRTLRSPDGGPDWAGISSLLEQWRPVALVVGLPLHVDGSEHELTALAQRFGRRLQGRYHLPVFWVDERLSSVEAEQRLKNSGTIPSRDNKEHIDAIAAQVILETWFARQAKAGT